MQPRPGYTHDLMAVPHPLRMALHAYAQVGYVPTVQPIAALLEGDYPRAIASAASLQELYKAIYFLRHHLPPFAWGTRGAVAKWHAIGGYETKVQA